MMTLGRRSRGGAWGTKASRLVAPVRTNERTTGRDHVGRQLCVREELHRGIEAARVGSREEQPFMSWTD